MGIIASKIEGAFTKLGEGEFRAFVSMLIDAADHSVHSNWQRRILDEEVERQLKRIEPFRVQFLPRDGA
jgi:hypothetical protein